MPANNRAQTDFGSQTIGIDEKQTLVDAVFRQVAGRYDLMNDLMSGGLHRLWKNALVTAVNPPLGDRPFMALDVAGGTGDVAFRIASAGGEGTHVTLCDINPDMLVVARERPGSRGRERVNFVAGNAESLPFGDRRFDACTIAFGIRNVPRIDAALAEFYRMLRPGGQLLCLEFSVVDVPGLDVLYDLYSFRAIPLLGRVVAGDAAPYRYLVESIRRFPPPHAFAGMVAAAGFRRVSRRPLTGGVVTLYSGWRL